MLGVIRSIPLKSTIFLKACTPIQRVGPPAHPIKLTYNHIGAMARGDWISTTYLQIWQNFIRRVQENLQKLLVVTKVSEVIEILQFIHGCLK